MSQHESARVNTRTPPDVHMSISDWLICLPWAPGRADVAATSALLFMFYLDTTPTASHEAVKRLYGLVGGMAAG
eukprot:2226656-Pyramimonas_sp.AAC.2